MNTPMVTEFRVGDVFARLAEIPDASVDLVVTSPPFLALRDYLPADHPDKDLEIGNEPTPAEFLDALLAVTAELGRVLAPHGSSGRVCLSRSRGRTSERRILSESMRSWPAAQCDFAGVLNPPREAEVKFGIGLSGLGDGRVARPLAHLQCLEPIAT